MDVGVRELKARLSEFLDRASSGETILVTEHGKPKAVIGPLPSEARIQIGISEGWIRAGDGSLPKRVKRFKSRRSVVDVLAEDRGE